MNQNGLPGSIDAAIERGVASLAEQIVFWLPRVAIALIVLALGIWIGRWLAGHAARPFRAASSAVEHFVERVVSLGFAVVGFALALNVLGLGAFAAGILASGSVVAIVLGFAFQEVGTNLIAGVFLAFNRPFKAGDIIECDGFQGVVRSLDLRTTHIRNFDGRDIFIPNATIFTSTLINYTIDDLRRRAFQVGIRYEDDALEAMRLLGDTAAGIPGVLSEPPAAAAIVGLGGSTVDLEVSYWVSMNDDPLKRGLIGADVMDACRRTLLDHGYTISANVTTAVELAGSEAPEPVHIELRRRTAAS